MPDEREPITNTTEQVRLDPLGELAKHAVMGTEAAIMDSEAQGQRELVRAGEQGRVRLPADHSRSQFEAMGIVFGKPVEGDPIFVEATLPAGWKIEPTGHSMWTKLVDDEGFERAVIFYKAAFYDRSAHMGVTVPRVTEAQQEAFSAIYDALPTRVPDDSSAPYWTSAAEGLPRAQADKHDNVTKAWGEQSRPDGGWRSKLHKIRRVTVAPDGTVLRDEIEELST